MVDLILLAVNSSSLLVSTYDHGFDAIQTLSQGTPLLASIVSANELIIPQH